MLYFDGVGGLLVLALWVFCFVDVITTPEGACRNLPKGWWLLIVLLGADLGSIVWLVAGRPWPSRTPPSRIASSFPEYDRPGRFAAGDQQADDDFLRQVRARAEEQRARYREQQRAREKDDEPES